MTEETVEPKKKRRPNLTEGEKAQLILMKSQGHKIKDIAAHFGIGARGVSHHIAALKRKAGYKDAAHTEKLELPNPKQIVQKKAYQAVEAGLDCVDDPYKRGNLGVRVLQGTGEFQPDGGGVNVLTLINTMPPEYRERYLVKAED
jgi:DNA-binding CsgD family transcriptional regulator